MIFSFSCQVVFFTGVVRKAESHTQQIENKIDSEEGRQRYGQRFATVEPVFGNIRHNKRLNRFTLRGQKKVDTQWKLNCLVHNIEKLAYYGIGREDGEKVPMPSGQKKSKSGFPGTLNSSNR